MKTMYHFFRLIRFANLLVIVLTMCVIQLFLRNAHVFENTNFVLLIISTVLIAAAGNIINDYFDVKADRINKPKRLIIGKYIKRRWAMVLHWSFNTVGMLIALYIGYKLQNIWVPLIAFLSINLLWFYSAYYKRKPLIGNIIVALLIGVLPIYVLLFNLPIENYILSDQSNIIYSRYFIDVVILVSLLAFLLNLIREVVKDIQDVRGDVRLGAQTLPIKYGIKKTKILVVIIFLLVLGLSYVYIYKIVQWHTIFDRNRILSVTQIDFSGIESLIEIYFYLLLILALLFSLIGVVIAISTANTKGYKIASVFFKLAMLFGLLTPLFL
jgi:4-hydroxybenzoate polyprenyltransferase